MTAISAADINYLLFVIPGFIVVWSFRRSYGTTNQMSEIEWAIWSFCWGMLYMISTLAIEKYLGRTFPWPELSNLGGVDGAILGLTPLGLVVGYVGAFFYRQFRLQAVFDFLGRFTRRTF